MKVAIVGAGVGGLTLAAAMRHAGADVEVEVYERDDAAFSRAQGYAIGLKPDGGLGVLTELGLRDAALSGDTTRVVSFVFTDQRGRELLRLAAGRDEKHATYRVQRRQLREVLFGALGGTNVHFGQTCIGYARTVAGLTVRLASGEAIGADLVIGADGVGSVIRRQVVGDERNFLGLAAINGDIGAQPDHPLLAGGYFLTLGDDGTSMFCYTQPGGSTHFSYTMPVAAESDLAGRDPDDLVDRVRAATAGWHPLVPEIVGHDVSNVTVRGYYDREPAGPVDEPGVWLIGDAAHPMCPFQGQGANTAMLDALDLARLIADGAPTGPDAARVAERIARRGRKAVLDSRNAARQFHTRSRFRQRSRNLGFRMANAFIRLGSAVRR